MDRYKVEHFEQTRGEAFPAYTSLDEAACASIRETIAQKLVLPRSAGRLTIVETLFDQSIALEDMNAQTPGFSLGNALRHAEIVPPDSLLVDWYRLDDIDRLSFSDLGRHFRDIWYPDADDITIFDDTLKWFVWIDHGGHICVNYL